MRRCKRPHLRKPNARNRCRTDIRGSMSKRSPECRAPQLCRADAIRRRNWDTTRSMSFSQFVWLGAPAGPLGWIQALRHTSMERGELPVPDSFDQPVLHRVEMHVVQVIGVVHVVADRMLPKAALPDAALAPADACARPEFGGGIAVANNVLTARIARRNRHRPVAASTRNACGPATLPRHRCEMAGAPGRFVPCRAGR